MEISPLSPEKAPPTQEWVESVVGRECEVYWIRGSASPPGTSTCSPPASTDEKSRQGVETDAAEGPEAMTDEDYEATHEEDWYDATIDSLDRREGDGAFFKVHFVGDETIYEMKLNPQFVRPSARAWVRRSKAILEDSECKTFKTWEKSLPQDTACLEDRDALEAITHASAEEFKNLPVPRKQKDQVCSLPSQKDLENIRTMATILRGQLYLRSRLAPIGDDGDSVDEEPAPTETYVNHLSECLRAMETACLWYYHCWELHSRCFAARARTQGFAPFSLSFIQQECLQGGRRTMELLITMDTSKAGSKRSRPPDRAQPPLALPTRRTKRKRPNRGMPEIWQEAKSSLQAYCESLDDEQLLSSRVVNRLVDLVQADDASWKTQCLGKVFRSLSCNVIAHLSTWQRQAEFYLGDRETLGANASDGETSAEDPDNDEEDENLSIDAETGTFVKYEDIDAAVKQSQEHNVLRHVDLSSLVDKLQQKLAAVKSFEGRAWACISGLLEDPNKLGVQVDKTMEELKSLLQLASSIEESPISNLHPIGGASSLLTRVVLQNAIVYRQWFLDLTYAENTRERVSFVEALARRMSQLPPIPSTDSGGDVSAKLEIVAPRLQALSAEPINHFAVFNRHKAKLLDRGGSNGILTKEETLNALVDIGVTPVISVTEEMLAMRMDVLSWEEMVRGVLSKTKPSFEELASVKAALELILDGRSSSRIERVRHTRKNTAVDSEIREFAKADLLALCEQSHTKFNNMFSSASAWKERADSILTTLRGHGNSNAGESISTPKTQMMVEMRRIGDLLGEYDNMRVQICQSRDRLQLIHDEAIKWSRNTSDYLTDDSNSFESCLSFVEEAGKQRPRGVIVNPTRQTMEVLEDMLRWYMLVKEQVAAASEFGEQQYHLILEGLEVLELFSQSRPLKGQFMITGKASYLPSPQQCARRPSRVLSRAKIESSTLSKSVLLRMMDNCIDEKEGCPLFSLLFVLWRLSVEEFCAEYAAATTTEFTLVKARTLQNQKPSTLGLGSRAPPPVTSQSHPALETLGKLSQDGERVEEAARKAIAASKGLLRECLRRVTETGAHLTRLKELISDFKARASGGNKGLILDPTLEQNLEQEAKLFGWLVRTMQYPALRGEESEQDSDWDENGSDDRVPWDVLVVLHDRIPCSVEESGDFACVVLHVKEVYEAATLWQERVSEYTKLSLRGGKRRNHSGTSSSKIRKEDNPADENGAAKIELNQVAQLSNHPVLSQVALPRENAIRTMLEHTMLFELQMHEFLGTDYEGEGSDRAAYPRVGSLVSEDGSFVLYRLTGSPLFQSLKSTIESIDEVANDVFAETPGMATFDWIRSAVDWIQMIHSAVIRNDAQAADAADQRLVIPQDDARSLVQEGEAILLNVPEDLRKTLAKRRISVSTSKDGKMTVKSKKGGAHHAIGVTAIRWCPLLYESLKEDVAKHDAWAEAIGMASQELRTIEAGETNESPPVDDALLFQFYNLQDRLLDLLQEAGDLVVAPTKDLLDSCRSSLANVQAFLTAHSNRDTAFKYSKMRFGDGASVVEGRHLLLESLLNRRNLSPDSFRSVDHALNKGFRHVAVEVLKGALLKGMETIGQSINSHEASAYCAMKGCEIENALFEQFQKELGETRASPLYRDKARALKRSIEDVENVGLCARILVEKIDAVTLVNMSAENLASPRTKQSRAMAEEAAKNNVVLTCGVAAKLPTAKCCSNANTGSSSSPSVLLESPDTSGLRKAAESMLPATDRELSSIAVSTVTEVLPTTQQSAQKKKPGVEDNESSRPRTKITVSRLGDIVKTVRSNRAPPPPPSLVASLRVRSSSGSKQLSNPSGNNRFLLSVESHKFFVSLYFEDDSYGWVDGSLPENLTDKGRLKIPEFTKFLCSKQEGGKWAVIPLRLSTSSEKDEREYKKFYKNYEMMNRIAMFSFGTHGEKLFLVTPKFHKAAKGLEFESGKSTYALILKRNQV